VRNTHLNQWPLVLCLVVLACGSQGEPGSMASTSADIVGGSETSALPAVGMLVYDGQPHCTGTLIGPRTVLTAGHCTSGFSASRMKFLLGPDVSVPEKVLGVAAVRPHPNYDGDAVTNDIGYVALSGDAPIAPLGVNPLAMDASWVGKSLLFVGYGNNDGYAGTGAGIKRAVIMPISKVTSGAFEYTTRGKNTCNGDSGGPAFVKDSLGNYLVAGVTSYGDFYCVSYGVDTRVDPYLTFLGISGTTPPPSPPPVSDPCKGETYLGRCETKKLIWCESKQIKTLNCSTKCGYDTAKGYYNCLIK